MQLCPRCKTQLSFNLVARSPLKRSFINKLALPKESRGLRMFTRHIELHSRPFGSKKFCFTLYEGEGLPISYFPRLGISKALLCKVGEELFQALQAIWSLSQLLNCPDPVTRSHRRYVNKWALAAFSTSLFTNRWQAEFGLWVTRCQSFPKGLLLILCRFPLSSLFGSLSTRFPIPVLTKNPQWPFLPGHSDSLLFSRTLTSDGT